MARQRYGAAESHKASSGYSRENITPLARKVNLTDVQLEQQLFWNAEDAFESDVADMVAIVSHAAKNLGIKVHAWVHELSYCPKAASMLMGNDASSMRRFGKGLNKSMHNFGKQSPALMALS